MNTPFWQLIEERVGCSRNPEGGGAIHDHLRQAPLWLWQKLNTFNPDCIQSFADGLDYHWTEGDGLEYIRHANIDTKAHLVRGGPGVRFSTPFRFLHLRSGIRVYPRPTSRNPPTDSELYRLLVGEKRDARGLLRIESRSPTEAERFFEKNAPTQTFSLGISPPGIRSVVRTTLTGIGSPDAAIRLGLH